MGVFEQFPYSNMQNANLDWVLKKLDEFSNALNGNIDKQIEKWVEENYNTLFFNASYDPATETITFAKGGVN